MNRLYHILLPLLFSCIAFSQSNNIEHPLDEEYQKCLQEDLGNYGERRCYKEFQEKWDEELNHIYNGLIKLIEMHIGDPRIEYEAVDSTTLLNLKIAQRQWLKYRDDEFQLIGKIYDRKGSMYYTIACYKRMSIIRQRALELMHYGNSFR